MKKCPYCAEEIQDEAIVCRYCRKDIKPKSIISVYRAGIPDSIFQKLNIFIDGKLSGKVSYLSHTEIVVDPGEHEMYVKVNGLESKPERFTCKPGETLYLAAAHKQRTPIGSLIRTIFTPKSSYSLMQFDGNIDKK